MTSIWSTLFEEEEDNECIKCCDKCCGGIGDHLTSFSWATRIKGFAVCFLIGFMSSLLGAFLVVIPGSGIRLFCALYTIGNLSSLLSTMFLTGPVNQMRKMFHSTRWVATTLMGIFLVLTLVAALVWKKRTLALTFCVCQFLAMCWYSLSYIPFARDAVRKTLSIVVDI